MAVGCGELTAAAADAAAWANELYGTALTPTQVGVSNAVRVALRHAPRRAWPSERSWLATIPDTLRMLPDVAEGRRH